MNKIILSLPKPILKRYVLNHFSDLSVTDFFQIIKKVEIPAYYFKRNHTLNKNSDVLSYMLDINKNIFEQFDSEAFSTECINKIANSGVEIYPHHIDKYPILLENHIICENALSTFPAVLKKMNKSQITERIITILENSDYTPDVADLDKSALFFKSEKLMGNAISENPLLLLRLENPTDKLINIALSHGYVPKKDHFIDHPYLKTKRKLLDKAFEYDPSIIVYFPKDQISNAVMSARNRGFVADEKDLLENPNLRNNEYIMEDAIKNNPKLITMLGENCYLSYSLMQETLSKYKITKEDLENNPVLTKNYTLMTLLPEFSLYSAYLNDEAKESAVAEQLKKSRILTTSALPFLDEKFGGKININHINELLQYLDISINEDDLDIQQDYLRILDKIIDGIIRIRYTQNKFSFKYPDIVVMNDSLIQLFNDVTETENYELISDYVKELYTFIGKTIPIEQLTEEVGKYFEIYNNQSLNLSITNEFCNKILNHHRDYFMNNEKSKILASIEKKLKLTSKKTATILNGRKMAKIDGYISDNDYHQLGITEEQFQLDIENAKNAILNNKNIKKKGIQFDVLRLNYIANRFKYYGHIDANFVKDILRINDDGVLSFIIKKFEQIKFKYIDNISLTQEDSHISEWDRSKVSGLNQTNYVIGDNDRYINNLSELLLKLDEETITKILDHKDLIKDTTVLLPFLNLIEELDVNTFINILGEYDRIKDKLMSTMELSEASNFKTIVLKKLDAVISLANAYSSVDDITLYALGRSIVSEVGEYNSSKYLDFYIQMANKRKGSIPPLFLQTPKYYLESGMYSDPERLLIGKRPSKDSCIDLLNSAGAKTYKEVLLQNSGDVILIRDAQKKLISRILLFRRGNVIQMVTRSGEGLPMDLFKTIGNQIIHQSIFSHDNIDYVFVNNSSFNFHTDDNISVKDNRFMSKFPHADFSDSAILLSSKNKVQGLDEIELDFDVAPLVSYEKPRKKISYYPTETEITRLRALKIIMETDSEVKENMSRDFEPFYSEEYKKKICGEDWYIAVKNDGTVEELTLPIDDMRVRREIREVKNVLGIDSQKDEINLMLSTTTKSEWLERKQEIKL